MENQTYNPQDSSSKAGPTIGIIIIIVVLLAGALYFFSQNAEKTTQQSQTPNTILEQGAADIEGLRTQSNSDSLNSIQQDLTDTNLTNLDKETSAINSEIPNLK
ncbi:MAG: hypothetical protein WC250_00590 [Candidatus Paceibacterota bacterium]|jgi:uncharacterized protein YpmB